MLISMPMVYSMEALKVFALTMKTDMTAKAPQDFAMIVIQNAEEELGQLLVKLLALKFVITVKCLKYVYKKSNSLHRT